MVLQGNQCGNGGLPTAPFTHKISDEQTSSSYATNFHHRSSPNFLPLLLAGLVWLVLRTVTKFCSLVNDPTWQQAEVLPNGKLKFESRGPASESCEGLEFLSDGCTASLAAKAAPAFYEADGRVDL